MIEGFNEWMEGAWIDVEHILGILRVRLSDEPEKLIADLVDAEAWYARAGTILAEANSWLDRAEFVSLPSRDYGTDTDRRVAMAKNVAPVREFRDKVEAVTNAIKNRITLGQSLLAFKRQSLENVKTIGNVGKPYSSRLG